MRPTSSYGRRRGVNLQEENDTFASITDDADINTTFIEISRINLQILETVPSRANIELPL